MAFFSSNALREFPDRLNIADDRMPARGSPACDQAFRISPRHVFTNRFHRISSPMDSISATPSLLHAWIHDSPVQWGLLLAVPKAVCERIEDLSSYAELLKE
jgi:hypothetical protein